MVNQLSKANVQSVVRECTGLEQPSLEDPSKEIILQEIIKNPHLFGRGFLLAKAIRNQKQLLFPFVVDEFVDLND
jgi:hypothetical protein